MKQTEIRVGLMASGFGSGTGPATYFENARRALADRCRPGLVSGAGCGEVDLVHVIDAKRLDPGLIESVKVPVALDFHDDYWVRRLPYPAPDAPLRRLRAWQLYRRHQASLAQARHVIVHSLAVEQSLTELLAGPTFESLPRPRLHMVPYGISEGPAAPGSKSDRGPIILMVGRDLYRKGFGVLVKALPRVIAARPGTRLVVIGNEYPHTRLAARLQARGLPVEFLPGLPQAQLSQWYERASALALPSWREAFGIVLIEAMAAGLPVAASRAGGIPEAVESGVSGLLSEPGDADGLAANLISLLGDEGLRDRLIAGGREQARKFSLELMGERLIAVYEAMMESG